MALLENVDTSALALVKYPDPVLMKVGEPVSVVDERIGRLARRMFEVMYASRGVGLAAPQVGVSIRLFVANPSDQPGEQEGVYVNPAIVTASGSEVGEEGCLSLPMVACKVKRATHVTVRATDLEGRPFEQSAEGLLARVFQHEMDHLDGVLLSDRMSPLARLANRRTLKELREEYAARTG